MLVNFVAIRYILLPFGIFVGYLVHFPRFGMLYKEKSGNPDLKETIFSLASRSRRFFTFCFRDNSGILKN
jgi:hypothetical protein